MEVHVGIYTDLCCPLIFYLPKLYFVMEYVVDSHFYPEYALLLIFPVYIIPSCKQTQKCSKLTF